MEYGGYLFLRYQRPSFKAQDRVQVSTPILSFRGKQDISTPLPNAMLKATTQSLFHPNNGKTHPKPPYQFQVLELAVKTGGFHISLSGSIRLFPLPISLSLIFSFCSTIASISTITCPPLEYLSRFKFCSVFSTSPVVMALRVPSSSILASALPSVSRSTMVSCQ